MTMAKHASLVVFVAVVLGNGLCSQLDDRNCGCDDPYIANAQTCERLFRTFESALLSDEGNLFKLRKLFYPSTSTPPQLVNITYHLQFTTANGGSTELPDSSGELPRCLCLGAATNRTLLNTSGIVTVRYGWTTIGIYTLIHPVLLGQLQVQLPFAIMRLASRHNAPFLWNGHSHLPNASIHLTISNENLTCLPVQSEVYGALKTLTSYVSQYFTGHVHTEDFLVE